MNPYGTARKRLLDEVVDRITFAIADDSRRSLPGKTSAGSRSYRHPERGTQTSGESSRLSRTAAQTFAPLMSASPSPGRPTRSLPPPDVDGHAPAAFLRVTSLAHRAQSTSDHHHVRTAQHRRLPGARPREIVASAQVRVRAPCRAAPRELRRRWTGARGARHTRSDNRPKWTCRRAPLSTRTTRTLAGSVLE